MCANNKGADQPARLRRLISAFLFRYSSPFFDEEASHKLNGEQNDTWNLLVSHRICHFRAIQSFDFLPGRLLGHKSDGVNKVLF